MTPCTCQPTPSGGWVLEPDGTGVCNDCGGQWNAELGNPPSVLPTLKTVLSLIALAVSAWALASIYLLSADF